MDVVRLGARYSSTYIPDELVEGYSSCIWTERFATPGEFEIKTPYISQMRSLLPEDTLISHLDTDEVMIVENHSVATNDEGIPELTITGRDLKLMLDHRYIEADYQKKRKMRRNYTAVAGLGVLLWNAFDNSTEADVTRGDTDDDTGVRNNYTDAGIPLGRIPNICITDSVADDGSGVAKRWWLVEGLLGPQFIALMNKYKVGFRAVRPGKGSNAQVMTVNTALATRGQLNRTYTTNITALRFDLYKGVNRSDDQSTNPKVHFSTLQGDLGQAQYLWSRKDYKTLMEVISGIGVSDVARNSTERAYTGWQRRIDFFDAGAPDVPPQPERPEDYRKNATKAEIEAWHDAIDTWRTKNANWKNKRDNIYEEFREDAKEDALQALDLKRRVVMLSGDVSQNSGFQYKVDYDLGDRVTLHGEYDMQENMIVAEYVRTDDENGDRGYPGLVLP